MFLDNFRMLKIRNIGMIRNVLWTILLVGVTLLIYITTVYTNGNRVMNYTTTNKSGTVVKLHVGEVYKENILINNNAFHLKKVCLYITDYKFNGGGKLYVEVLGQEYVLSESDIQEKIEFTVNEEKESDGDLTVMITGENSWIDFQMDSVTKGIYIEKNYDVVQLDDNGIIAQKIFEFVFWVLVLVIVYLIVWTEYNNRKVFYAIMTLVLFLVISLRDITLILNPQAFAEQIGTHYYWAVKGDLMTAMFTTEAGYCAAGKRLIAYLICLTHSGRIHFVLISNVILVFSAAASCGLFINAELNFDTNNRKIGYIMALYLPMIALANFSNFLFIDQGYWGIPLILYMFLGNNMEDMDKIEYSIAIILSFGFCITQGHYVILLPFALIYIVFIKGLRNRIYGSVIFFGALLQLLISYRGGGQTNAYLNGNIFDIYNLVRCTYIEITKIFTRIWGINNVGVANVVVLVAIFIVVFFMGYKFCTTRHISCEEGKIWLMGILGAIELVFMYVTTNYYMEKVFYEKSRYEMFLITTAVLFVIYILGMVKKKHLKDIVGKIVVVVLVTLIINGIYEESLNNYYQGEYEGVYVTNRITDWKNCAQNYVDQDSYFIKLDPTGWFYTNFYYNTREVIVENDANEGLDDNVIAVFAWNPDISKSIELRIKDKDGRILYKGRAMSSPIKSMQCFYLTEAVSGGDRIEFYDARSGSKIDLEDYSYVIEDTTNEFIPRG